MTALPGWDSVESSAAIAHVLHVTAVVVLFLLFIAEGLAVIYDARKDHLTTAAEGARTAQQQQNEQAAEAHRRAEVAELQKQLAEADKKAATALQQQASRNLTDTQKQTLINALTPFRGQKVDVVSLIGDADGLQFAQEFVGVFQAAGWDVTSVTEAIFSPPSPIGIEVTLNQAEAEAGRIPQAAEALVLALIDINLADRRRLFVNPSTPADRITFRVGTKPPIPAQ